ncbi:SMP 30 Gluconolaconase LRE like region [Trypanosoma vivax]|nr:hypothetical protein TRVL_00747 [Trypanosoma vivax]KAH8609100.1 SMP 30 Gluconolaconase LRE like region [Trypanosoma vivax]
MELVAKVSGRLINGLSLDLNDDVFAICSCSGEVLRLNKENSEFETIFQTDSTPHALAVDCSSGKIFISDRGENVILKLEPVGEKDEQETIRDKNLPYTAMRQFSGFEGRLFVGPTALACGADGELYFTDGGAEGDSSFADPVGAVYRTLKGHMYLVSLCPRGLVRPSGIAITADNTVYVCEQGMNRVLRFVQRGTYHVGNVFAQLHGRMGPSAIAVSPRDGSIFVAHYDMKSEEATVADASNANDEDVCEADAACERGLITVLGKDGEMRGVVHTPTPCITAIAFDRSGETLYVMETDEVKCCSYFYKFSVPCQDELCPEEGE